MHQTPILVFKIPKLFMKLEIGFWCLEHQFWCFKHQKEVLSLLWNWPQVTETEPTDFSTSWLIGWVDVINEFILYITYSDNLQTNTAN